MLIFIWWWFPRTYRRGVSEDNARLDDADAQAHREMVIQNAREILDNYRETWKQRELAKNAKAQAKKNGDVEAQVEAQGETRVEEQPSAPDPTMDSSTRSQPAHDNSVPST